MLERLKKLNYVSVKETDNLEKLSMLVVEEDNNVYSKTVSADIFEIDNLENIPEFIEKSFVQKVESLIKHKKTIEYKDIKESINQCFDELKPLNEKFHNEDKFIITSKNIEIKNLQNISVIVSEYLDNKIIIGYKTQVDQPGIIVITNENGLSDKNNIQIAIIDIGFYPEKAYYILKIT